MKFLLYSSFQISEPHLFALESLVGKEPATIKVAAIDNAVDIFPDAQEWIGESRNTLAVHGAQVDQLDLREWRNNRKGLREKLASYDVIWLCGGHGFYLRWLLRETGADDIITELVEQGTVYAGWSAGAIMAGPTLKFFERFDDPKDAPEMIWDGLGLTKYVIIPHIDLDEFSEGMHHIDRQLMVLGYMTVRLRESQALVIDGEAHHLI